MARYHSQHQAPDAGAVITDTLESIAREGARPMLERMLAEEVDTFLGRPRYAKGGRRTGYRNGHGREREVGIGTWSVPVRQPRVSDLPPGSEPFESSILPKRRYLSMETRRLFARLYPEGLGSGDFEPAFRQLMGEEATLSASTIIRLKTEWQAEYDQALYAFLVEKGNRSGSKRTVESYSRMLWRFFADTTPDQVTPAVVLSYAHGTGLSGRLPSPATIGARIGCLSSYYRFLIRMGMLAANPCDRVERPRQSSAPARGYSADEVRRLLEVIPDTIEGRRDRAILLAFILTGRRRTEVIDLKAGDIELVDGTALYSYRGKGGKRGRRELPRPAWEAIQRTLADCSKDLAKMAPDESLWQAGAGPKGMSGSTFYARFRRYLAKAGLTPTGLHILRHSAAKLRRDAGESVESVSAFLDHSSLAVTTTYLRRLEGVEDHSWERVADAIGA